MDFNEYAHEGSVLDRESESILILKKNRFAQWVKIQFFKIFKAKMPLASSFFYRY